MKIMEDFYANLVSLKSKGFFGVKPWITLEIARIKGEICFYVAAPRYYASFIERELIAYIRMRKFPAPKILIFSGRGKSSLRVGQDGAAGLFAD